MPISYRIDRAAGVVHVTFRGRVTIDEFRTEYAALFADPNFRRDMHRITDTREITELPRLDELRAFASVIAASRLNEPEGIRRAVIVGSAAAYGVGRQYQVFLGLSGAEIELLHDDAEVAAWLASLPRARSGA